MARKLGADVPINQGGTAASSAAAARTALDVPSNAEAVLDSLFDANSVLKADSDNTPAALTMGASTILARLAAGSIVAATPAQLRTLLALVVGTDVQAWDADLAAIAALTSSADKVPYSTAAQTWALATLTSFGRTLIDDADAPTARTTLGLGTLATQAASAVAITGGTISGVERKWWKDLDLLACMYPDGSGTGNNPGRLAMITSTASQVTNGPKVVLPYLQFSPTTDESVMWMFRLPQDYVAGSAATLYFAHNEANGSNSAVWKAAVASTNDGDSFAPPLATVQTLTVASVANPTLETSAFTLTMTGINGGEYLWVMLGRDADNGSDTQTGDAYLFGAGFECQVA